jgi:predicted O-linked N-acetylglucosamine transferase (SPINDLY family)
MDDLAEARRLFHEALALQEGGDLAGAETCYERALALAPGRASVMNNLAAIYIQRGKLPDARWLCENILRNDPDDVDALLNLGNCLVRQGAATEALPVFDRVLGIKPGDPGAHFNRGTALLELRRAADALASFDSVLAIDPGHAEAHFNRGNALMKLGRPAEALASHDQAVAIQPAHTGALNNRALVLQALGRREELIEAYRRLLGAAPDFPCIPGYLLRARLECCDWEEYDESVARISEGVRAGKRADSPFHFLAISESAVDELQCARTCAADEYPAASQPLWRGERYAHERIRIAYVSADLHNHAVPFLMAGLLEAHDRTRFEITAISLGPNKADDMRARLKSAVDRFVDAREQSDGQVALLMRELEVDIAVDLQGYTWGCRPGIFAHRPAPVQVNYLGYPGTMGAPYVDYILGDRHVIPPGHAGCYEEKIVWLPDSYQVNDSKRKIATRTPARIELGLPETGFVFCCFNNNHKIAPRVFDAWMRVLGQVNGSVLWLLEDNEIASRNLRREAMRRGVAPERLIFAPRVRMDEHLARQRRADLFLDTLPYNAHVTASDALWAGLPVLTCQGNTFAGRVAASLLNATGMQELVTTTWEAYERLALKLATDRDMLAGIKTKLARNRADCPLFDTDGFRRHVEAAYATMHERAQRGDSPANFTVARLPAAASR